MSYQFDFAVIVRSLPVLLRGAILTMELSLLAILLATVLGVVGAVVRLSRWQFLKFLGMGYVEVFRNTPLLIQIFFLFFALPGIGIRLSAFTSGLLALTLYTGAYNVEVFRAGIEAVPKGLREAAASLGMTSFQSFRHVILPVAIRISLPALGNNFVALLKNSSLVSTIGVVELTFLANDLNAWTFRSFEIYGATAVIYLLMVLLLVAALRRVEGRLLVYIRREA